MTELEKKAKVYRESRKDLQYFSEPYKKKIEKAYVDGAKENGIVWHDLRKNPKDLPNCEHGHTVFNQDLDKVIIRDGRFEFLDGCKANVIAWCEIPKYTEE